MQLKIDEEFKSLIPPLTAEEFGQLKENIIKDGCRDALVTWGDILIDGHNRYQICTENDIPFQTVDKHFETREDVIEWIIKNQFGRRNINTAQRCNLGLILEPILQAKAKENKINGMAKARQYNPNNENEQINPKSGKSVPINTDKEIAKVAGVGHNSIHQFRVIKNEGEPELLGKVLNGEVSINKAYQEVRPKKEIVSSETRVCSICSQEKPASEFYGRATDCKACQSARKSAGLSAAKTRELNEKYPDELLNSYYEEMRNHDAPNEDVITSSKNVLANELNELLHDFNISINKFLFSENLLKDETFLKYGLSETIHNLNKINDFIKEDM